MPARTTQSGTPDKPPKVSMNLDTLQREAAPEPFVVVVGGRPITFTDPQECDWQELQRILAANDPQQMMRLVINPADHDHFFGHKIAAWKVDRLAQAWQQHYGLNDTANLDGLQPPLNGTARP